MNAAMMSFSYKREFGLLLFSYLLFLKCLYTHEPSCFLNSGIGWHKNVFTSYGPYSLGFSSLYNGENQTSVLYKVSSLRYCGQVPHFKLSWWHTMLTIQFVSFSWTLWFAHNFRSKLDSLELCNVAYNTLSETKFIIFLSNKQNIWEISSHS